MRRQDLGSNSSPLAAELQSVAVDEIPQRLGHYVRNELIFGLNGTGSQPPPRYRLMVVLRERVQTPILDTVTGRATSATVIVDAEYRLVTIPDEVEVTKGIAFNIASYDRFSNRFSNVRAARDAEIRNARVIAEFDPHQNRHRARHAPVACPGSRRRSLLTAEADDSAS